MTDPSTPQGRGGWGELSSTGPGAGWVAWRPPIDARTASGPWPPDFVISIELGAWRRLREGDPGGVAEALVTAGGVAIAGIAPFGPFLAEANDLLPAMPGVTTAIVLKDDRWGDVELGVVDGHWVEGHVMRSIGRSGTARLRGGVPQFLRLLSGARSVRSDLLDGAILGDLAGLSQLSWMAEQPAWVTAAIAIGPLLDGSAAALEAMAVEGS